MNFNTNVSQKLIIYDPLNRAIVSDSDGKQIPGHGSKRNELIEMI